MRFFSKEFIIKIVPFILPAALFCVSIFTISDYGMNWDSPVHFGRGEAFLHYFLTGKTDYKGIPAKCIGKQGYTASVDYKTGEICNKHRHVRVSEFEQDYFDFSFFRKDIYGHPPLSDILAAITNYIFFVKLGWLEDIDSYHLYIIISTFILGLTVAAWAKKMYGNFASIIAVLALYLFPLLLGEQHFNIKDPPMAAFFTLSIFLFWLAIVENKAKYMIFSAIAAGISFSTKFNYVFAPFILLPWFFAVLYSKVAPLYKKKHKVVAALKECWRFLNKKLLIAIILYPFIILGIFYFSWPVLWSDPIKNISLVIKFYTDIGAPSACAFDKYSLGWIINCSSLYTIRYFLYTTPLITLFFFTIGNIRAIKDIKKNYFVTLLLLTFFWFTILRVTLAISNIYGGIRQIIEFVGPMSMLTALGAVSVRDLIVGYYEKRFRKVKLKRIKRQTIIVLVSIILIALYIPISIKMMHMHPNENVYFNPLIGGLKGAASQKFPDYANTYGNPYLMGVKWLNEHAEKDAVIALVSGSGQNISRYQLRGDLDYEPGKRSGYNQAGEYNILLYNYFDPTNALFRYKYLDKFMNPVYSLEVEGVPLLKIWKNNPQYVVKGIDIKSEEEVGITTTQEKGEMIIDLGGNYSLKRLEASFHTKECKTVFTDSYIYLSPDGKDYTPMPERLNDAAYDEIKNYSSDLTFVFTGERARFIKLIPSKENTTCNYPDISFSMYQFTKL